MFLAAVDAFVTVAIGMALVTSAFSLLLFDVSTSGAATTASKAFVCRSA